MTNKLISKVSYFGTISTTYTVDEAGKEQGEYEKYYGNGQLLEKGTYKDGLKEGPCELYHENGQLREKCTYKDGKKEGLYKEYDKNGQLKEKSIWKNGKKEGPYEEYYENGQLREKSNYRDGHPVSKPVLSFKMALKQGLQRFSQWNTARAENEERDGLNKRLEQITKQMPPTQLRQTIKRNEVAEFRKKYPKSSDGR